MRRVAIFILAGALTLGMSATALAGGFGNRCDRRVYNNRPHFQNYNRPLTPNQVNRIAWRAYRQVVRQILHNAAPPRYRHSPRGNGYRNWR